jgi:undecaprenyl pyrophosphate synthase
MPLTSDQLDAIHRLLLEPLRETIKAELHAVSASVDRLGDELRTHVDHRIAPLERELARQKRFRRKLATIYGGLAVVVSVVWSIFRDKVMRRFGSKE